jgi:hypothetical protein
MLPRASALEWRRGWQRLALAFGDNFQIADAGLLFQQFQLCVAEFFAGWAVLLNPLQPQPFFQKLDFQVGELQLAFQLDYRGWIGGIDDRGCGSQHG